MSYAFMFVMGLIAGTFCVYLLLMLRLKAVKQQTRDLESQRRQLDGVAKALKTKQSELNQQAEALKQQRQDFDAQVVSYKELQDESGILKRDLQNIEVNLRKLVMDRDLQEESQEALDTRAKDVGSRYLKDNIKWLAKSLTPNNYAASKQRLQTVIKRCRGIGFDISTDDDAGYLSDLKVEYEKVVRAAFEREEQARIKAQIREEQKRERQIAQELQRLDRERAAIQAALDKAMSEAEGKHSEEIERLRSQLAEAEEKTQRTKSQAELTKSGHVYVISNIGSFGEGVFKIGMTRRLEPEIRVRELGDASVPFPFDVHMMISCDDAPALENALHQALHKARLNKVNPRKEYFRAEFDTIHRLVEEHCDAEVLYTAAPEATEYRQSLEMSDEDAEYIDSVYDAVEQGEETVLDDE